MKLLPLIIVIFLNGFIIFEGRACGIEDLAYEGEENLTIKTYSDQAGGKVYLIEEKEKAIFYTAGSKGVANTITSISKIEEDGCKLYYRGYPIEEWQDLTYPQIAYLLIHNEYPKNSLIQKVLPKALPIDMLNECQQMSKISDPIVFIQTVLLSRGGLTQNYDYITDTLEILPTLFAYIYRHQNGKKYISPRYHLSYENNLLFMMHGNEFFKDPHRLIKVDMLRILLNLHAEHSTNASTSTMRNMKCAGSSFTQCLVGAMGTLSGHKHGGANIAALEMYRKKIISKERIPEFIDQVKNKKAVFMGMGHRIYNGPDPRYEFLMSLEKTFFKEIKPNPLFEVAKEALLQAQSDQYFISRGLHPNIDAISGFFLEALGIPETMFTAFFALSRTAGWCAHYLEEKGPIFRPSAIYTPLNFKQVDYKSNEKGHTS